VCGVQQKKNIKITVKIKDANYRIKKNHSATMLWPAWFSNLLATDWWGHILKKVPCIMTSLSKTIGGDTFSKKFSV
jgi:hypothetical protein